MLAVGDGDAAIAFYAAAFGAELPWRIEGDGVVAGMAIDGAPFFLAHEAPAYGTRAPGSVAFTTVRIELFVEDPREVQRRAIAAGAREHGPVHEDRYVMEGPRPIRRILQGAVLDPFGHLWRVGKILE